MLINELINNKPGADQMIIGGKEYKKGDKLRLMPGKRRTDAADIFLKGKVATLETIYTDYDDKVYLAVTMDEDPGQDMWREMGIYRFFQVDEVEKINHED